MCQAIPRRVVQVERERALVDLDGAPTWVGAVQVPDLAVDEYVVVYAGQALERVDAADAEEMLAWYASMASLVDETLG